MSDITCCVCRTTMRRQRASWCFRCPECGTWASTLPIGINAHDAGDGLDEDLREVGLAELRHANLALVADRLVAHGVRPPARVLDVGSAHGWFLRAAAERGFDAEGVEPDEAVAARPGTGRVRIGFFPEVLEKDEVFDAITYNDVLEHLPDVDAAVAASVSHLAPGGLLSVNIPNSRGLFFRVARACYRIGLRSAFERLWQVGLPSPHLWFFDRDGLTALCERHGLERVESTSLDSVRRQGLWQRAHADRRPSVTSVVGFAVVWVSAPLFNARFASDIMHLVFRAPGDRQAASTDRAVAQESLSSESPSSVA
ncbi:class I SAM-dependent methyltransferase [Mumia zhuanghuii]|uniref:Class I SAM-dependent methyltransferase n=1 Tax=Mumia zhuanghuii TaxID=2585211 RepID=A0A5C4MXR1_9ACTN|nr:class I SAM-dependent methyltransferase [Mumia zhuanghuii]TNC33347.1 class I SAM-dependent methyltransferase [Mumia zhuanghuii]TNC48917.1 class I SAM-dependent methyltransferase [Mumia zhuanghuii]